jgi:hypothetical protein
MQNDHLEMSPGNRVKEINNFLTQVPDLVHVETYVWI